ncbi:unnamed protein product [Absidia cylindrospora]
MTIGKEDPAVATLTEQIHQDEDEDESRPATKLNGPSPTDFEKKLACGAIFDMNNLSPCSDDGLDLVKQQDMLIERKSLPSYSSQDRVVVIIMASSAIDKGTTVKELQQKGYHVEQQLSSQLLCHQIDALYAYDGEDIKSHSQQLFDAWKKSSICDPVELVLLEKQNAVKCFKELVTEQRSTEKKIRIMDPDSIYSSNSHEHVKRDIELLFGTKGSNVTGDYLSSATMNNCDDTVTQTSSDTLGGSIEKSISAHSPFATVLPDDTRIAKSSTDNDITNNQQSLGMTMTTTTATFNNTSQFDIQPTVLAIRTIDTSSIISSSSGNEAEDIVDENKAKSTVNDSYQHTLHQSIETPSNKLVDNISSSGSNDDTNTKSSGQGNQELNTTVPLESKTDSIIDDNIEITTTTNNVPDGNENQSMVMGSETKKEPSANKYATTKQSAHEPSNSKTGKSGIKTPPLKSKIRVTTAARSTTALTKHSGPDDSKKGISDDIKKNGQRIPRVALLAQQNNKPLATGTEPQQQQVKSKTKTTKGAIARLSTPTASSARRRQTSSVATGPSTAQLTTTSAKGTSVTATLKLDQRKKRLESSTGSIKNEVSTSNLKTRLAKSSGNNKKIATETNIDSDNKEDDLHQKTPATTDDDKSIKSGDSAKEANDALPTSVQSFTDGKQELEQDDDASSSHSPQSSSSSLVADDEKKVDDMKTNDIDSVTEILSQSSAESITTSPLPQTPVRQYWQQPQHQERSVPTTTPATTTGLVTLDTVNATPIRLIDYQQNHPVSTNKVKDLLGRFM